MVETGVIHEAFATMLRSQEEGRVPLAGRTSMGEPYAQASHLLVRGIEHCDVIRVGDFILFDGPGGWIAHRVIWILPKRVYVTKGDANRVFDAPYPTQDRLLGKVTGWTAGEQEHLLGLRDDVRAVLKVSEGLLLWAYRAFLIRVLKKKMRVEDLV